MQHNIMHNKWDSNDLNRICINRLNFILFYACHPQIWFQSIENVQSYFRQKTYRAKAGEFEDYSNCLELLSIR